ncbi:MAG: carbohydrate porin, partial [Planctomycetes bacterium]|nr:carbohydrate porin [Planctomycetota bacterium]
FGPRDAQVVEAYYAYMLTPAIVVTPDLQWVQGNLGGLSHGNDAFIYGIRMNIHL